jgi:hydrogenase nickel incorporation protein HypA/HybF
VRSVTLELGELNLIEEEQLRFWVRELGARDGSPDVQLKIRRTEGRVRCKECGEEGAAGLPAGSADHLLPPSVICQACGGREVQVTGGRELRVVSAEVEEQGAGGEKR